MNREKKLRIGIIGSATPKINPVMRQVAKKLGKLIAFSECEVATGASIGMPHLALLKAKENGAKTIGFSPEPNEKAHSKRHDIAPLNDFNQLIFIDGFTKRSIDFILSCDAIIVLGGRMGTLSEYSIAFEEGKPIAVLSNSGGIAQHLKKITSFCDKHREKPIFFYNDIELLFRKLVGYLKKDQWHNLVEDYKNSNSITDEIGYLSVLNLTKDYLKGARILDYGCGNGKFSKRLEEFNTEKIFAVDTSSSAISAAKKSKSMKISYHLIQNAKLDFIEDNSLDFAFANFVLCCVENSKDLGLILKRIYKKLKADGKLIILEPHPNSLGYNYISIERERPPKLIRGIPVKVKLAGMKNYFYDYWRPLKDYKSMVKNAGFIVEKILSPTIDKSLGKKFWKDETVQSPHLILYAQKPAKNYFLATISITSP